MPKYTVDGSFFMQQLSGIFFHMHLMDADFLLCITTGDLYIAISCDWLIEL